MSAAPSSDGPSSDATPPVSREVLVAAAMAARARAYAPYSRFHVGAALAFADGRIIAAANVENASYGLSLCAETNAVAQALGAGLRGGLVAVAIVGGAIAFGEGVEARALPLVTPCGRCRQVLSELAQLGGTDPQVWCGHGAEAIEHRLSQLLPLAFGPASLGQPAAPDQ